MGNITSDLGTFSENGFIKIPLHVALNIYDMLLDRVEYLTEIMSDKVMLDEYCEESDISYEDAAVDLELAKYELDEMFNYLRLSSLEKMN